MPEDRSNRTPCTAVTSKCRDVAELTASSRYVSLISLGAVESSEEETVWPEGVSSRESSPDLSQLPCHLSVVKRRAVDTIMQEFQRLFNQSIRSHIAGGHSSNSSSGGTGGRSSNTSTYSSASIEPRKRSLSRGGSISPDDDDDANKRRRPSTKFEVSRVIRCCDLRVLITNTTPVDTRPSYLVTMQVSQLLQDWSQLGCPYT
jgi:hypothetical protein